jgi:hypothetical protein
VKIIYGAVNAALIEVNMKSLTERAKELAAAEEVSQKVEGEAIQREKAAANELGSKIK